MWKFTLILVLLMTFISTHPCMAAEYGKVTMQKVTEGVYLFTTAPYGVGLSGNSVAVVSDGGVLVFDSAGLPETAKTILTEIRSLTARPVRYLVNSHWHWDHWSGNEVFAARFPDLEIVAHENTRKQLMEVEPRWNAEGLKTGLPSYLQELEKELAASRANNRPETEIRKQEEFLQAGHNFLKQKTTLNRTLPNVTFSGSLKLYMGGTEIQIRSARAITVGDAYVYLPGENIVITGDILLSPYPYAIGGTYPSGWLKTLQEIAALNPAILIPGHGPAQDRKFLERYIVLFQTLLQEVSDCRKNGSKQDPCVESIGKRNRELARMLGIEDSQTADEFKAYFLDVFVSRAYRELEQPLGDLPDGLPQ